MRFTVPRVLAAVFRLPAPVPPVAAPRRRARSRARLALALVPPAFALVLTAAWVGAEAVAPAVTDREYHASLRVARAARAAHPDRPLGVVLGSSRTAWAFEPELLPESVAGAYWVNVSQLGSGPTLNRLILHRLLRDGVRPAVAVIEVMPLFFVRETDREVAGHVAVGEAALARAYADRPSDFDYHFARQRVTRAGDLGRVADPFAGWARRSPAAAAGSSWTT